MRPYNDYRLNSLMGLKRHICPWLTINTHTKSSDKYKGYLNKTQTHFTSSTTRRLERHDECKLPKDNGTTEKKAVKYKFHITEQIENTLRETTKKISKLFTAI